MKRIGKGFNSLLSNILVIFFVLMLLTLTFHVPTFSDFVIENMTVVVELNDNLPSSEKNRISSLLSSKNTINSLTVKSIDKIEAMSGYGKEYKMSFDDGDNPFKDIIVFSMAKGYYNESELLKLKEELELEKSVSGVYYEIANIDIVKKNLYYISSGIFGFSLLFIIMAFSIMYNDIKLSLTKDTKKIKTMQLVGAGSFFIKRPYLKEIFFNVLEAYFIALLLFTGLLGYLAYSYILLSGMFSVSLILLSALLTLIFILLFNLFFGNRIIHNFLYKVN